MQYAIKAYCSFSLLFLSRNYVIIGDIMERYGSADQYNCTFMNKGKKGIENERTFRLV